MRDDLEVKISGTHGGGEAKEPRRKKVKGHGRDSGRAAGRRCGGHQRASRSGHLKDGVAARLSAPAVERQRSSVAGCGEEDVKFRKSFDHE